MKKENIEKIRTLKNKIKELPTGYISKKNINGNIYFYHQWTVDGVKQSKFVNEEELDKLNNLIEKRKEYEKELRLLKKGYEADSYILVTLMHKDVKVVNLTIASKTGLIIGIGEIYNKEHLPIGTFDFERNIDETALSDWWNNRNIPFTRSGFRDVLEKLNISNPQALLLRCYGLSLSDQYWIDPIRENNNWKEINFFDNEFSTDVGEILFGKELNNKNLNLSSPDNTSMGNLKKRWQIINGKRILLKGGSNPFRQEPYNEVVACKIAKTLGIDCIDYSIVNIDGYPYSECEDFVDKNTDLITAHQISKILKKENHDSAYSHFLRCCFHYRIKDIVEHLSKMIVFDFIIANEDRHFNNFGFVRDINNLKDIKFAPLFDNGSSFGFDKIDEDIDAFNNIISKPFYSEPLKQLTLVASYSWLNINSLNKIKDEIESDFLKYESKYLNKNRINKIVEATKKRIDYLINAINNK